MRSLASVATLRLLDVRKVALLLCGVLQTAKIGIESWRCRWQNAAIALAVHCSCNAKLEMWECHAEGSAAVKQHEFGWAKSG
jgi:hypothetical protein